MFGIAKNSNINKVIIYELFNTNFCFLYVKLFILGDFNSFESCMR